MVTHLEIAIVLVALPITAAIMHCVALLERCERHLRGLHIEALGPMHGHLPEDLAIRRRELGLDDGYPHKQTSQVAWGWLVTVILLAMAHLYWHS